MPSERVQRRIDNLLDQTEEAVESTEWARVRELSLSVLAVDTDNEDAKSFLAMAAPHLESTEALARHPVADLDAIGEAEEGSALAPSPIS